MKKDTEISLFLWVKYRLIHEVQTGERLNESVSIGLCTYGCWFEHQSWLVQCQQIGYQTVACERWTLTQRQKKNNHTDKTSRMTSLFVWIISCIRNVSVLSSPGNWYRIWKSATQTPTSEQEGLKVSGRVCLSVCVNWMSLKHSHVSSKPHTAALLSFPKHVLVSVFSLVSAVSFRREEERWVEGAGRMSLQLDSNSILSIQFFSFNLLDYTAK